MNNVFMPIAIVLDLESEGTVSSNEGKVDSDDDSSTGTHYMKFAFIHRWTKVVHHLPRHSEITLKTVSKNIKVGCYII